APRGAAPRAAGWGRNGAGAPPLRGCRARQASRAAQAGRRPRSGRASLPVEALVARYSCDLPCTSVPMLSPRVRAGLCGVKARGREAQCADVESFRVNELLDLGQYAGAAILVTCMRRLQRAEHNGKQRT